MAHSSTLGAKLGPRIAEIVVGAMVSHLRDSADTRAAIHKAGLDAFWDGLGKEAQSHLGPIWRELAEQKELPDHLQSMFHFAAEGSGEWSAAMNLLGYQAAANSGLGAVIANMIAPYTQHLLALSPALLLPYGTHVQLTAQRVLSVAEMHSRGARQGMMSADLDAMLEGAYNRADMPTLLELLRRGLIDENGYLHQMRRQGYEEGLIPILQHLRRVPLAPADAALMVLRGIIDENAGRAIGREAGYEDADFDRLVLATGEPPGPEALMEALRRKFIDTERFDRGIRQSRIRNEWIDVMTKLRYSPMATADAVEAVVRNYIPADQGKAIAEENGLEPEHWPVLLESHGRPPGHMEMIQLQRRGLVDQAQVDQAVRESDIKDKYVDQLRGLYAHLPPERTVITMLAHGGISAEGAVGMLRELGFSDRIARAITKTGTAQRTAGHKEIALSTVLLLYESHTIDEARARELITALGYPDSDVPLLLATAELKRQHKWREAAIAAVRSAYLAHHIEINEAVGELSALGVPASEVDYLRVLWEIELRSKRRTLTEAQVIHGYRQGHIDAANADQRLQQMGYSASDAAFLIDTAGPIPKGH